MTVRVLRAALAVSISVAAVLYIPLISRVNINWDEFRYLADVYAHASGRLTSPLQTIHVHLFAWLPAVGSSEVDQIIAARAVYLLLLLASTLFVYLIARRLMSQAAAMFAALCCLAYAEVIRYGFSFRFDGLAIFLLLGALALLLQSRTRRAAGAAGVLSGLALLVTLKCVFLFPTLTVALWFRRAVPAEDAASVGPRAPAWRETAADAAAFAGCFLVAFAILYAMHRSSLAGSPTAAVDFTRRAGARVLEFDRLFPAGHYFRATVLSNPVVWLLLLDGIALAIGRITLRRQRPEMLMLLALLLPLFCLVFYRNGYPYFYVFLMPPALVLCGLRFDAVIAQAGREGRNSIVPPLLVGVVLLSLGQHAIRQYTDGIVVQRRIVEAVHEVFPRPVPYIDRNSMIASFPKVGFFMSTWGFANYYDRGVPVFADLLRSQEPKFVLANHPALVLDASLPMPQVAAVTRLMPEDLRVLQENFVPHWGPIFIAGKQLVLRANQPIVLDMLIPGEYTLEAARPVVIGDMTIRPGGVVMLSRHRYHVLSPEGAQIITLRWGRAVYRPTDTPPTGVLYAPLAD